MFNTRLKHTIAAQAAELAELRQLRDGLQREMLTVSIDPAFIILRATRSSPRPWVIGRTS